MRLIVLGAAGMLGQALVEELGPHHQLFPRDLVDYDLRDLAAFRRDLEAVRPQAVINAAAYTQVDQAEREPELATEINGEVPGRLAELCRGRGARFVHLGTDYIFDGALERPYREDDPPAPLNAYGRGKLLGEQRVMAAHPEGALILRTSWLFGHGGKNFVRTMLERRRGGQTRFRVVADQRGRPTYATDLARAIEAGLVKGLGGVYHAANAGVVTWRDFALEIFAAAGLAAGVEVTPIGSAEYAAPARRPANSALETSRFEAAADLVLPSYRDALARYLAREGVGPGG